MAIVLNTTPGTYLSAHGDLIFVPYEATKAADPVTYPNYKYVCDVYVNGVLIARQKAFPHPDNDRGIFNIGPVVRNYLETTFSPAANVLRAQEMGEGEFFVTVQCKFGEEYNDTLFTNLTVDSARIYFNHYNGRLNGSASTILSSFTNKPLTNRPTRTKILADAGEVLIPYFPTSTTPFNVVFTLDDATTETETVTPTAANNLQQLNVSPGVIDAITALAITDATKYYTVEFNGVTYRFDLVCEAIHEVHTLHFLNQFGGFESYSFTKVSRTTEDIERKTYGKLNYRVDGSGVVSNYNSNKVYHENKPTYATKYNERLTLNSDLLKDAEYTWLSELVRSPLVYIQEGEYFLPVTITNNNYDYRKTVNDKLTNLTITIEYGKDLNTQFR